MAPRHARRIHPGGGIIHPSLLVDGRVVGTWRTKRRQDRLDVVVAPFDDLAPDFRLGLEAEVGDLGRFVGVQAMLRLATPA